MVKELSCIFAKLLKKAVALKLERKYNERSMQSRSIPGCKLDQDQTLKYGLHRLVQLVLHQRRSVYDVCDVQVWWWATYLVGNVDMGSAGSLPSSAIGIHRNVTLLCKRRSIGSKFEGNFVKAHHLSKTQQKRAIYKSCSRNAGCWRRSKRWESHQVRIILCRSCYICLIAPRSQPYEEPNTLRVRYRKVERLSNVVEVGLLDAGWMVVGPRDW